jgi:GNAT superfamily N-acetyltransferase
LTTTFSSEAVSSSQLDSERFGIRVARARITSRNLCDVLDYCEEERVDLLIARCATTEIAAVQKAEARGFLLTDTLLYYQFDLRKRAIPQQASKFLVRSFESGDEDRIRKIAVAAFNGYMGHYHADARLNRQKCDDAYVSWAERSCIPGLAADKVLVAEDNCDVIGFATLRLNSPQEIEGLLFAVTPEYQGSGVCGLFMVRSLEWALAKSAQRMIISTQVTNISMQKVWCRLGFEPSHSFYTLHKWFDR